MKYFALTLILLGTMIRLNAQDLSSHIPQSAVFVMTLDFERLSQDNIQEEIRNIDELRKGSYSKKGIDVISQVITNPAEYGVDISQKAFVFLEIGDTIRNLCILVGINNEVAFKSQAGQLVQQNNPDARFETVDGVEYMMVKGDGIAISGNKALIIFGKSKYYHGGSMPYQYYNQKRVLINMLREDPESVTMDILDTEEFETVSFEQEDNEIEAWDSYSEEATEAIAEEEYYEETEAAEEYYDDEEDAEEDYYEEEVEEEEYYEDAEDVIEVEDDYYEEMDIMDAPYDEEDQIPVPRISDSDVAYASPSPASSYDPNHPVLVAFEEKWEKQRQEDEKVFYAKQAIGTRHQLNHYLNLEKGTSVKDLVSFKEVLEEESDISFWYSGKSLIPMLPHRRRYGYYNSVYGGMHDSSSMEKAAELEKLISSNYSTFFIDLNKDRLDIKTVNYTGPELGEYIFVRTSALNSKMYNYVEKDPLFVAAMNIDPEKAYNMQLYFWKTFAGALGHGYYGGTQLAGIEALDLFLNKDVLFNTFTGEGMFVVNGLRMDVKETVRYMYDEEYNRTMVPALDTSYKGLFVWMMALGNEDYMRRMITIYEHLGVIVQAGHDTWVTNDEKLHWANGEPLFTIAIRNGMFFMYNDPTMSMEILEKGLPDSRKLSGSQLKDIKQVTNGVYVSPGTDQAGLEKIAGYKSRKMLELLQSGTYAVQKVETGKITSTGSFQFNNASNVTISEFLNALIDMVD